MPSRMVPPPCSGCGRRTARIAARARHPSPRGRARAPWCRRAGSAPCPAGRRRSCGRARRRPRRCAGGRPGPAGEFDERPEHLRRQIVDDVPVEVFERVRHRRPAGARHSGDDQHFLLLVFGGHRRRASARSVCLQPIDWRVDHGWPQLGWVRCLSPRRSRSGVAFLSWATEPKCLSSSLTRDGPRPGISPSTEPMSRLRRARW